MDMNKLLDETIILHKNFKKKEYKKEYKKEQLRKGEFTVEKKKKYDNSFKLDEDTGDYKSKEVNKKLCSVIQKARLNKNYTQKTLAQKLNIQTNLLNEYESGKKNPDNATLAKLEKYLKVKLRGDPSKIGNSL